MKHSFIFLIPALIISFSCSVCLDWLDLEKSSFDIQKEGQVLGLKVEEHEISNFVGQKIAQAAEDTKSKIDNLFQAEVIEEVKEYPCRVDGTEECEILSQSGAIIDSEKQIVLYGKNANEPRAIASITKLMTALVFLDYNPGWEEVYQIQKEDRRNGGTVYLYYGEKVRVKDLFHATLVGSANTATIALIQSTGMSEAEFVEKMNEKAIELGLNNTYFVDATGLDDGNVSTAEEVVKMAKAALSFIDIRQATIKKSYNFTTLEGTKKYIPSTDYLLENLPPNGIRIIGGKTGYTVAAGYCFVGEFVNDQGNEIIAAVLGSPSYAGRFEETKELAHWAFDNYEWGE